MSDETSAVRRSDRLAVLRERARLTMHLRQFFEEHSYWEVETPLLSTDCCVDAWLEPFSLPINARETGYLQTSPEFGMKRLMCEGADRIYQLTRSFRRDEVGQWHNPEFTILEWYAKESDHHDQMEFVEQCVLTLAEQANREKPTMFHRLTYEQAFRDYCGICPFDSSLDELSDHVAEKCATSPSESDDRDNMLNVLLAEVVEPELAELGAVFLFDYPATQAALARVRKANVSVAERFELYLDGIEICNGYHEITDPSELHRRMSSANRKRIAAGLSSLPVDSRLLEAMQNEPMPQCAGVALGWDRLVAWLLKKNSIQDVSAFLFDEC